MPTNTYVALDTRTLSANTAFVEFTGISSAYTDLVLVGFAKNPTAGDNLVLNINNATSGYSNTRIIGNGSTATSSRTSNFPVALIGNVGTEWGNFITQFMNYSNTTTFKTFITRCNFANSETQASVNLYQSTSAISSIKISMSDQVFSAGSTFSLYGIRAEGVNPAPKATGGAIYSDSTYYYHVFGSTGTFTPLQSLTTDVLVVAGGGGGGSGDNNGTRGGGGAGGFRLLTSQSMTTTAYTCTVGAGGTNGGSQMTRGTAGVNSSVAGTGFSTITASGGGFGGNGVDQGPGGPGGSGGGAGDYSGISTPGSGNAGGYAPVEGFAGGTVVSPNGSGGGGAGATGSASTTALAGNGGVGSSSASSWGIATGVGQNVNGTYFLAGGGGGGRDSGRTASTGGNGGGGRGCSAGTAGVAGTANTGGGGGGGGNGSGEYAGGAGGSGVIIVRYLKA